MLLTQVIITGILVGFVFAFVALGLTMIFGVMKLINLAHGEFLMIGMYIAFWTSTLLSVDPLITLPLTAVGGFLLGGLSYYFLIRHILRGPTLAQLFGTFGLMLFLRYGAMFIWGVDVRVIKKGILIGKSFSVYGFTVSVSRLVTAAFSLFFFAIIYWMINKTKLGKALRATSMDPIAARYMGINTENMNALAWGMGGAIAGVAGGLLSNFYYINPTVGMLFSVIAFATVVLGGLGSIRGALLAGLIVGLVEALVGQYISIELKFTFLYLLYFFVVVFRPQGLLGWGES